VEAGSSKTVVPPYETTLLQPTTGATAWHYNLQPSLKLWFYLLASINPPPKKKKSKHNGNKFSTVTLIKG